VRRRAQEFLGRPNAAAGSLLLALVALAALLGAVHTPFDPIELNAGDALEPPSLRHWFGTDQYGRDVFSRILIGAGVSLRVSLLTVACAVAAGVLVGALTGYLGGWLDRLAMVFVDALMAFPGLLLALAILTVLGPSPYGVVGALGLAFTPSVVRVVRGTVLSIREKEYVEASRVMGNGELFTVFRHVLPNCVSPLIVLATLLLGRTLLAESALSFLGLGVPPPAPTWGGMLADSRPFVATATWLSVFPGVAICLSLLGVNLLGDALRDELDPRARQP
jgi:peptide/nickel transport system permease protein